MFFLLAQFSFELESIVFAETNSINSKAVLYAFLLSCWLITGTKEVLGYWGKSVARNQQSGLLEFITSSISFSHFIMKQNGFPRMNIKYY